VGVGGGGVRTPWHEVGVFDRDTRSYVVDRIPRPPEARAVFERSDFGRESLVGHELKAGCPKCFEQTIVRWHRAYSDSLIEDFRDQNHPEIMGVAVARELHNVVARAENEKRCAQAREAEALKRAQSAEERFKRIQIKRARQAKKKESTRRAKGRAK
jgi:hypothetical protein